MSLSFHAGWNKMRQKVKPKPFLLQFNIFVTVILSRRAHKCSLSPSRPSDSWGPLHISDEPLGHKKPCLRWENWNDQFYDLSDYFLNLHLIFWEKHMYIKAHKLNLFYNLQYNYNDVHECMGIMATSIKGEPKSINRVLSPLTSPPRLNSRPKSTHAGCNSCPSC